MFLMANESLLIDGQSVYSGGSGDTASEWEGQSESESPIKNDEIYWKI